MSDNSTLKSIKAPLWAGIERGNEGILDLTMVVTDEDEHLDEWATQDDKNMSVGTLVLLSYTAVFGISKAFLESHHSVRNGRRQC
jgi:hypothetical protein